jgi:uncharacterized protein with HEPN domain
VKRKKLARPALRTILESIAGIEIVMADKTLEEYSQDRLLRWGVERAVEIISEASRRLTPAMRAGHPEVEWKQVMGIGNVLRHDYDEIIDEVIYGAIRTKLPQLKAAILAIESSLDEPEE